MEQQKRKWRRPCEKCDEMFERTSRTNRVCDSCRREAVKISAFKRAKARELYGPPKRIYLRE